MSKVWLPTILLVIAGATTGLAGPGAGDDESTPRIGVYDSRAVAVAFTGSQVYEETRGKALRAMMAEHRKAEATGDKETMRELEAEGERQQQRAHRQGFGTAPVDDILKLIEDKLPAIRKEAKVSALFSRWDDEALARYPNAERIDVTLPLIDAFQPNERQRKSALEIRNHAPVSAEVLEQHEAKGGHPRH